MRRLAPQFALCALVAGFGMTVAGAQTPAPSPALPPALASAADANATTPAALAAHPAPAPDATAGQDLPPPTRAISSQTAARLTASMPGYVAKKPAAANADDDQADATAAETPKNDIIRLPDYIVRERPPPVFTQREILTPKALAELEFKKHPGLNLWGLMPFSSLNAKIALEMYDEEARLDNITELADTAHAIGRGGDSAQDEYIKKETQQTFMHDVWGSGDENDGK
jgi:hypothetical protein